MDGQRRYGKESSESRVNSRAVGRGGATNNSERTWETRERAPDLSQDYGTGYGAASQSIDIPQTRRQIGFSGDTTSKGSGSTRPPRDFSSETTSESADRLPGSRMRHPQSYFETPIPKGNSLSKFVEQKGDYLRIGGSVRREDETMEKIDKTMQIGEDGTMEEIDETTHVGKDGQRQSTNSKKKSWFSRWS